MNGDELQQFWHIPGPYSILPISQGVNNLTQIVETPAGSYILRSYRADRSLEQIRYELSVLKSLRERPLPFQVPVPIPTVTGELFAVLAGTVVSLVTRLPGSPPPNTDLEQNYAAGMALAELVEALRELQVEITPQVAPFPPSGDFEAWSGIPIAPADLLGALPIAPDEREQVIAILEETQASALALYRTLPQQIIHRDYDQSNILMEGNSVTGILDFEFCGPDLHALDLAYALSQWPSGFWNTGKEWAILDAFGQGYFQSHPLTLAEIEALPQILRLRAATSLFFHGGRFAQGVETAEEFLERIRETLTLETWLRVHEGEFVKHIQSWHSRA
jgi:homoserine kinase type II